MARITYVAPDGKSRVVVEAEAPDTVMEAAMDNDVEGIVALCGGGCSCSTCHIYIDEAWVEKVGPSHQDEKYVLAAAIDVRANSRLGCQIPVTEALDGLIVHVPAEQAE